MSAGVAPTSAMVSLGELVVVVDQPPDGTARGSGHAVRRWSTKSVASNARRAAAIADSSVTDGRVGRMAKDIAKSRD